MVLSKYFVLNCANFDILVRKPVHGPKLRGCLDIFPRLAKSDYSQAYAVCFSQFITYMLRDATVPRQCSPFRPRPDPICRPPGSSVRAVETTIDRRKHLSQRPIRCCFSRDSSEKKRKNYTIEVTRAGGHGHPCALDPVFNRVLFAAMLGLWSSTILS